MRRILMLAAAAALVLTTSIGTVDTYAAPNSPTVGKKVERWKLPKGTDCTSLSTGGEGCVTPDGTHYYCPTLGDSTLCEEVPAPAQTRPSQGQQLPGAQIIGVPTKR